MGWLGRLGGGLGNIAGDIYAGQQQNLQNRMAQQQLQLEQARQGLANLQFKQNLDAYNQQMAAFKDPSGTWTRITGMPATGAQYQEWAGALPWIAAGMNPPPVKNLNPEIEREVFEESKMDPAVTRWQRAVAGFQKNIDDANAVIAGTKKPAESAIFNEAVGNAALKMAALKAAVDPNNTDPNTSYLIKQQKAEEQQRLAQEQARKRVLAHYPGYEDTAAGGGGAEISAPAPSGATPWGIPAGELPASGAPSTPPGGPSAAPSGPSAAAPPPPPRPGPTIVAVGPQGAAPNAPNAPRPPGAPGQPGTVRRVPQLLGMPRPDYSAQLEPGFAAGQAGLARALEPGFAAGQAGLARPVQPETSMPLLLPQPGGTAPEAEPPGPVYGPPQQPNVPLGMARPRARRAQPSAPPPQIPFSPNFVLRPPSQVPPRPSMTMGLPRTPERQYPAPQAPELNYPPGFMLRPPSRTPARPTPGAMPPAARPGRPYPPEPQAPEIADRQTAPAETSGAVPQEPTTAGRYPSPGRGPIPSPEQRQRNPRWAQEYWRPTPQQDPRGLAQTIIDEARKNGIDENVALRVAFTEGLGPHKDVGDEGTSFGAFQFHMGDPTSPLKRLRAKGLGDDYLADTGRDPRQRDASGNLVNERDMIRWAMARVRRTGWKPWYGATNNGIDQWAGIPHGETVTAAQGE